MNPPDQTTQTLDEELDRILGLYTAARNVQDSHGNTYYDFTYREAKAALRQLMLREVLDLIGEDITGASTISTKEIQDFANELLAELRQAAKERFMQDIPTSVSVSQEGGEE